MQTFSNFFIFLLLYVIEVEVFSLYFIPFPNEMRCCAMKLYAINKKNSEGKKKETKQTYEDFHTTES